MAVKKDRFVKIEVDNGGFSDACMAIYVDRETGVNYLFAQCGYAGGLTPLLNADGTPIVTPVPREYNE